MVALVLDYCCLCTNKFFFEAFLPNKFFFWFCLSQKKLIIINFSKHIFVLKTSKKNKGLLLNKFFRIATKQPPILRFI